MEPMVCLSRGAACGWSLLALAVSRGFHGECLATTWLPLRYPDIYRLPSGTAPSVICRLARCEYRHLRAAFWIRLSNEEGDVTALAVVRYP